MSTKTIEVVDNENIYIDCNPVNSIGKTLVLDDNNNVIEHQQTDVETLNEIGNFLSNSNVSENLGVQFLIAVTAFAIIYGIGNYVFKTLPNEMLEKKLNSI